MNGQRHVGAVVRRTARALLVLLALGCDVRGSGTAPCGAPRRVSILSDELRESSGLAASRRHPGLFWTHDDSDGEAELFAIDTTGQVLGRVRVVGARNRDWEAIALGPCPAGECLYIADTGDNLGERDDATIFRIPEPAPSDTATEPAERFPIRYPDGPRDTEAIYILPNGRLYLINKGRHAPISIYSYPGEFMADQPVELRRVARLGTEPVGLSFQVTDAAATPDGRFVAVRTYTAVQLYRVGWGGRLRARLPGEGIDVQALAEPQGEGIVITNDGTIFLISESGPPGVPAPISRIDCRLD